MQKKRQEASEADEYKEMKRDEWLQRNSRYTGENGES